MAEKNPWAHTIYLPQTKFPMKAELTKREPQIIEFWKKEKVYQKLIQNRKGKETFILHDGPPYANGNFHMGHALNKILKDIINKFELLLGKRVVYIPGWDCHGLPIEMAVLKEIKDKKDGRKVRQACRQYATKYIQKQAQDQTRFGVLWDDSEALSLTSENQRDYLSFYYTMSPKYEAAILRAFTELFKRGFIFKGKRPVLWCPVTQTAHAEAEVEYREKTSPSIYVAFPLLERENTFVVIWTTTPWTLPANLAVAFHPEYRYAEYETERGKYIIAEGLEESFFNKLQISYSAKKFLSKDEIQNLKVKHPFYARESKVVFAEHVSLEAGTGIVHTAPGHGYEDYLVGQAYGLEPYSPVDERGYFHEDVEFFAKMNIYDANEKIITLLQEKGLLLKHETIEHQYPHSWRSHAPLIFRATEQWFLKIDPLRKLAEEATKQVVWIPKWGENRFSATIQKRIDWCLSRQRYWGVPIPAFRCQACGKTLINEKILTRLVDLVEKHGLEIWFEKSEAELLGEEIACEHCGSKNWQKEQDILDVWFDSGVSWYAVLKSHPDLTFPADLYLEGSDQHRGWFQSSLWPALAIEGSAPYKKVLTHGYVLDEKGRAMSKSLGNVISPTEDVIAKYGADVLRLWAASEDYRSDNKIGFEILEQLADSYRKIRNTFRYLLGNLQDQVEFYLKNKDKITEDIDFWVLQELSVLEKELKQHYQNYEFHLVYHKFLHFCTVILSQNYFDIIRDRLYCEGNPEKRLSSPKRESALATLAQILVNLNVFIAPILTFTAEEIAQIYMPGKSILEVLWPDLSIWNNPPIKEKFNLVFEIKAQVNSQIEELRKNQEVGSSLETIVFLSDSLLKDFSESDLANYFVVSQVFRQKNSHPAVVVKKSPHSKCPRCWQYLELGEKGLCHRCEKMVF